jgi:hypothetical protein
MFVIASERVGGIDVSAGYTAYAMSEADAKGLAGRALALLQSAR